LPKEAGSTVILPEEVTVLMGSDFDIDTLYTMIPNFKKNKDGNYSKVIGDSREGRENRIQDIFRKILLEPKLFNETVAPLDSDTLKNVKSRALNLTNIPEIRDSVNLPYIQTDMSLNNMMGKDLIGVFANYNANRSIAEDTKLKIVDKDYSIKFNGTEATELFNKTNIKGNNIASQISEMLSAAVDNAKELTHYIINSNTYTASVYALILESGHDLTTASYFMLQPGIVKAYNKQKTNSGINKEFVNIIQSVKDEYLNRLSKSTKDSVNKELLDNKVFNFTDNKMQEAIVISRYLNLVEQKKTTLSFDQYVNTDEIKSLGLDFSTWNSSNLLEEYSIYQIQALHSFESYRVLSAQRGLILKNQKIDGYNGNSLAHLEIFKTNIDSASQNTKLLSYDDSKLTNQKELYKALLGDTKNSAINFISKYIPFSTPAFTQAKNSIIVKLGIQDKLKSAFTGEKILSKINYELLTAINGNKRSPFFSANKSSSEYLKQLVTSKGLYNNYQYLMKEYPFLKDNYFVRKMDWNESKELVFNIGILQNRSSERLQNAFQELIEGFGIPEADKQRVEDFAIDLIRYSYLTKGFQSGFDSFIKYVPSEWLQSNRLGYNEFMKDVEYNLQNPDFIEDKLVDEVIGNLANLDGIVGFYNKEQLDKIKPENLPIYIKNYSNDKVTLLKREYNSVEFKPVKPLGRKANGKKGVLLKEYSGDGLNFTERPIVEESKNTNTLGKPLINPTSIKDKGEDLEKECNN